MSADIRLRRAYDAPASDDGYRVLVDRLWPRGVSRNDARIDEWARDARRNNAVVLREVLEQRSG